MHIQTPALTIIDDFLPEDVALCMREGALATGFRDLQFMGGTYQGTNTEFRPREIAEGLAKFIGAPITEKISAFRSGHEKTDLHVNIHADNTIDTQWASVYYLNQPFQCRGGTAFYSLKSTGWDQMPTQEQLDEQGMTLTDMTDKWTDESAWDLVSLAGMKWNRMIFYPTRYFHSRYPLKGWGTTAEDSRLVRVSFFDIG